MVLQPPCEGKILLHACCAPCSGAIVECMVRSGFKPVIFWSNSNIYDRKEYELRRAEMLRYAAQYGLEVVDDDYDHPAWLETVRGLEREPERGKRCLQCFRYRLERAARYAAANGFSILTTTLASSRWKDKEQVNAAGRAALAAINSAGPDPVWWDQDWRKGGLQIRRSEIIREQNFYNQTFCGCDFSKLQQVESRGQAGHHDADHAHQLDQDVQ